jgi:hypothetical protein
MPEKQRMLWALLIACVVLAVGAVVVGSESYTSLAGSALLNTPAPLGAFSQLSNVDGDDDDDGLADQLAAWGLILLMCSLLVGRLLRPLYNEQPKPYFIYRGPKLNSIFNPPLERPG